MPNKYFWLAPSIVICVLCFFFLSRIRTLRTDFDAYVRAHPEKREVPPPVATVKKLPKEVIDDDPALRNHWDAINRCKHEGNVPVMGYNYAVVCLHKPVVAWTQVDSIPF